MAKTLTELGLGPVERKIHDICYEGFRSLLDTVDKNDPHGVGSRAGNAKAFAADQLKSAFLGPFFIELREGGLTLRNARNLNQTLRYVQSRMDEQMKPLNETYLRLLAWENFVEIPAPLVLLGNCLESLRPPARFDFDLFESQKGPPLHGGPTKLLFVRKLASKVGEERPGVIPTAATDMLEELDSIFVRWLRNAVAHCSYLIDLGSKTVSDSKEPKNSFGFDEVRDLYLKAFGYLEGFKKAVHQFALETSGASYAPNWGPNY